MYVGIESITWTTHLMGFFFLLLYSFLLRKNKENAEAKPKTKYHLPISPFYKIILYYYKLYVWSMVFFGSGSFRCNRLD